MDIVSKSRSRRAEIRKNRPDTSRFDWQELKAAGVPASLVIGAAFFMLTTAILLLRQDVIPYRPDQPLTHDIVSRVAFTYNDPNKLEEERRRAGEREPRVYAPNGDAWGALQQDLASLPNRIAPGPGDPPADLKTLMKLDAGATTAFRWALTPDGADAYKRSIEAFVKSLRESRPSQMPALTILPEPEYRDETRSARQIRIGANLIDPAKTFSVGQKSGLRALIEPLAEVFPSAIQAQITEYVVAKIQPTHILDEDESVQRSNAAKTAVSASAARQQFRPNSILVHGSAGRLTSDDWLLLKAENSAYLSKLSGAGWKPKLGIVFMAFIVTVVMSFYIYRFQPRIVFNHMRASAIAALMLSMLLLAALAGVGNGPIYLFGLAPTLLVAMILTIAYDKRFAMGIASMHGLLSTIVLNQAVTFFLILWVGVLAACFLLDDIRARSKLIEVGGATAIAMIFACAGAGLLALESPYFVLRNCLYSGAAGLAVGFIVLGILPFVERTFRITTSMTLLELADVSHPLLRRLAMEAPGTYSHSLQVATLAEAAAEAIGANSLLCRVGSYYHDVGKINKADYFVENQTGGENRHINLNPSVSYYIITGHVKDGVELAKEYNLPTSLTYFIQQHHGTTLVEYFYRQACARRSESEPDGPEVADHEYRYVGPRPRSREVAIVMVADAAESATRSMAEPTPGRIEGLVNDLAMRRLLDGQFDECDLTMRDLEKLKRAIVKTLVSIYHGRLAYPSTASLTSATGGTTHRSGSTAEATARSA